MQTIKDLFARNRAWAKSVNEKDPEFFSRLAKQQTPDYLWIGCSDSRVPANQIIDLPPGEVFVHRNIANVVVHSDLNCLSVIQFAVEYLKVSHIIVCGHYGCGGVAASLEDADHGLIDNWLGHIEDVARVNADALQGLENEGMVDRLCELNVIAQVANVCRTSPVQKAWRNGVQLTVCGWIYDIKNGILQDLVTRVASNEELDVALDPV